jgi:hypothetical protein
MSLCDAISPPLQFASLAGAAVSWNGTSLSVSGLADGDVASVLSTVVGEGLEQVISFEVDANDQVVFGVFADDGTPIAYYDPRGRLYTGSAYSTRPRAKAGDFVTLVLLEDRVFFFLNGVAL